MRTNFLLRALLLWVLTVAATTLVRGYNLEKDSDGYVITLAPGTFTMRLKMPAPASPLIDGTNYNSSVQAAMASWNSLIGIVSLNGVVDPSTSYATGNGVNEIVMDSTAGGEAFDSSTLAITIFYYDDNIRVESDTIFNTAKTWDSYRGSLSAHPNVYDIRRVAIHELGHTLGLDHPDDATPPQNVNAIMNSHVSDIEVQQQDDIDGARALYGAPGFVPTNDNFANATVLTLSGSTVTVTGTNIGATKQVGEPNHASAAGGHSVWWKWTAPSSGTMTVTTLGSDFDTLLAVYTGTNVSTLTNIAANDDVTSGSVRTSSVTFSATSGTTYYIAVDGFNGYFGQITLNGSLATSGSGTVPTIPDRLGGATVATGSTVTFAINANGSPTSYQWYFNGAPISGATSSTLVLTNVQAANVGTYYATASNSAGTATSNTAGLLVFTLSNASQPVATGHDAVLLIPPGLQGATFQWQVSSDNGATWTNVTNNGTYSGATTTALTISGVTSALANNLYRATMVNGTTTSTTPNYSLAVNAAFFTFPRAVGLDGSGAIYVADSANHVIQKISTANVVTTLAGTSGQAGSTDGTGSTARFNQPSGLVAASDGSLTVADTANGTIRSVTSAGAVSTLAGSTTARGNVDATGMAATFSAPLGVARDAAGNIYVADSMNHTIRKVAPGGVVTTIAGSAGASGSADGTGTAARFNQPSAVAVDAAGNLYVADTTNNTIRKITPAGAVTTLAGLAGVSGSTDGTGSAALFSGPTGITVDGSGNVFVADTGNSTIRQISSSGVSMTVAGLSTISGLVDGQALFAWFNQPRGIVWDGGANLYVADTGNAVIRKVTIATGVTTTLNLTAGASTGGGGGSTGSGGGTTPTTGSSGGGGGGGGAASLWFAAALGSLGLLRWRQGRPAA